MRISILLLNGYNVLSPDCQTKHIGGMETQLAAIARGLRALGHEVSCICMDEGQGDGKAVPGGLRVLAAFRATDGLRGIRFVWPRMTSVWAALDRADPDVCLQGGADSWTGVAAMWCSRRRRAFVFVAMNDPDCHFDLPLLSTVRERVLARYGMRRASLIIAQTQTQQEMLLQQFSLPSRIVRPCIDGWSSTIVGERSQESSFVLWVGRFTYQKRMEWYLDAAERLPELGFCVVGSANHADTESRGLEQRARALPNVALRGFVPHNEMPRVYAHCSILVCTSRFEGFPTTFIEAWSFGIPIVTTFDPDGVVARNGLGRVVDDVDGLVSAIRELSVPGTARETTAELARTFYQSNHSVDGSVRALEQSLQEIRGDRA